MEPVKDVFRMASLARTTGPIRTWSVRVSLLPTAFVRRPRICKFTFSLKGAPDGDVSTHWPGGARCRAWPSPRRNPGEAGKVASKLAPPPGALLWSTDCHGFVVVLFFLHFGAFW